MIYFIISNINANNQYFIFKNSFYENIFPYFFNNNKKFKINVLFYINNILFYFIYYFNATNKILVFNYFS